MNKGLLGVSIGLALAGTLDAAVIDVGDWDVPVGSTEFRIPLQISGEPGEQVRDMAMKVQIADGGPQELPSGVMLGQVPGPEIVDITWEDTIWTVADDWAALPSPGLGVGVFRQLIQYDVSVNFNNSTPVEADGVLAWITLDVSEFSVGESFELMLRGTKGGNTRLTGPNQVTIHNGLISIIPEPNTMAVLASGLLAIGGYGRRSKK